MDETAGERISEWEGRTEGVTPKKRRQEGEHQRQVRNKDGKKQRDLHLMGIPLGKRRDRGEEIPDNMSENVPEPMQRSMDTEA